MSLYKRVTCAKGGTCNTKGHDKACSKCGKRPEGGAWWYRFRFGGRIIHESSRSQSLTVAREAEKQRRRQLEESWNRIEKKKLPPTFEQAGTEWLRKRAALKANTRETYQHALKHLNTFFGKRLICDIEAPDVAAYQKTRAAENAAGATANKEFTVLASILADHNLWNGIRRDAKRLEENESAGRALLPDEESTSLADGFRGGREARALEPDLHGDGAGTEYRFAAFRGPETTLVGCGHRAASPGGRPDQNGSG